MARLEALTKKIEMGLAGRTQDSERIRALERRAVMHARKLGLEGGEGDTKAQA
jgi:hypothetical protein